MTTQPFELSLPRVLLYWSATYSQASMRAALPIIEELILTTEIRSNHDAIIDAWRKVGGKESVAEILLIMKQYTGAEHAKP